MEDQGVYLCTGTDRVGTVLFQYEANLVIGRCHIMRLIVNCWTAAAAPRLLLSPARQEARPGDSPQVECRVQTGDRPVDITWTRQVDIPNTR